MLSFMGGRGAEKISAVGIGTQGRNYPSGQCRSKIASVVRGGCPFPQAAGEFATKRTHGSSINYIILSCRGNESSREAVEFLVPGHQGAGSNAQRTLPRGRPGACRRLLFCRQRAVRVSMQNALPLIIAAASVCGSG